MPREIKTRFAEAEAQEQKLLDTLRRKPVIAVDRFKASFTGTSLEPLLRKTRVFLEFSPEAKRQWFGFDPLKAELRYEPALLALAVCDESWKRPLETWQPRGKSGQTVLRSLIAHLLCLYPTPPLLIANWANATFKGTTEPLDEIGRQILLSVGAGDSFAKKILAGAYQHRNITFPPITKRQAHLFLTTRGEPTLLEALRQAQTESFGGSWHLAQELSAAFPGIQADEAFTAHVIQWFCQQGMFDLTKARPLVDYIRHCRGQARTWEIMGRTVTTLLEGMEAWHTELKQRKAFQQKNWTGTSIPPYNEGDWTCKELCTAAELHQEGKAMRHCVGSYASRAASGQVSVWSLRESHKRCLTVEVSSSRVITQARGACNAKPKTVDMEHLRRWAAQAGLRIGSYL